MPDLEALLDETRAALLAGDILRLAALADRVAAAPPPADLAQLDRTRRKAARNATLLSAAMKGLRAARRRAEEAGRQGRFSTYDAQGRRDEIGSPAAPARRF